MSTFEIRMTGKKATMIICGEVTIQNISEFKQHLLRLQEAADDLALNIEGIGQADVACLQMICCAHRTWLQMNKRLTIEGSIPAEFAKILKESGYCRKGGCRLYSNHPCLWERRDET
jgi:anti-anti-sigma regulatory factor